MPLPDSSPPDFLEQVLSEYMERLDRGEPADRSQLLARYPELAEELQAYFAGADEMERLGRNAQHGETTECLPVPQPAPVERAGAPATAQGLAVGDYDLLEQIG